MQWIECTVNLSPETIEPVGAMLDDIGIAGYLIEDERDFLDFLEHNRAYWDIVDEELSQAMKGVSRIKFYLADDETGRATLTRVKKALAALPHALPQFHWDNLTLCEQPRADED